MEGNIPIKIASLEYLKELNLKENRFDAIYPYELSQLSHINQLYVDSKPSNNKNSKEIVTILKSGL